MRPGSFLSWWSDHPVETVLHLAAEGGGADHADRDIRAPQGPAVGRYRLQVHRRVEPGGVGTVPGVRDGPGGVAGGEDVLAERQPDFVALPGRVLAQGRQLPGDPADEVGRFIQAGGAEKRHLEAIGVVVIGAGEILVVLRGHGEGAGMEQIAVGYGGRLGRWRVAPGTRRETEGQQRGRKGEWASHVGIPREARDGGQVDSAGLRPGRGRPASYTHCVPKAGIRTPGNATGRSASEQLARGARVRSV
jgi:hypothetical protein